MTWGLGWPRRSKSHEGGEPDQADATDSDDLHVRGSRDVSRETADSVGWGSEPDPSEDELDSDPEAATDGGTGAPEFVATAEADVTALPEDAAEPDQTPGGDTDWDEDDETAVFVWGAEETPPTAAAAEVPDNADVEASGSESTPVAGAAAPNAVETPDTAPSTLTMRLRSGPEEDHVETRVWGSEPTTADSPVSSDADPAIDIPPGESAPTAAAAGTAKELTDEFERTDEAVVEAPSDSAVEPPTSMSADSAVAETPEASLSAAPVVGGSEVIATRPSPFVTSTMPVLPDEAPVQPLVPGPEGFEPSSASPTAEEAGARDGGHETASDEAAAAETADAEPVSDAAQDESPDEVPAPQSVDHTVDQVAPVADLDAVTPTAASDGGVDAEETTEASSGEAWEPAAAESFTVVADAPESSQGPAEASSTEPSDVSRETMTADDDSEPSLGTEALPAAPPQVEVPDSPASASAAAALGVPIAPDVDVSRETDSDAADSDEPDEDEPEAPTSTTTVSTTGNWPQPRERRVMTVANQKGGVGKTTSTVNLAVALALHGVRVLVIDLDPQGNASTAFSVPHTAGTPSIYDVLIGEETLADVSVAVADVPNLWCAPATIDLAGAEIELVSVVARESRLRRALDSVSDVDYVFIDCPPSLGLLTLNAMVAANEVLIPIQCEFYALEGLSQLLNNVDLVKKHLNADLTVSTILLTMYDGRTRLADQVAAEVRSHFGELVLDSVIPRSVRISEAPGFGQTVVTFDPSSRGALAYIAAAYDLAQRGRAEQSGDVLGAGPMKESSE